MSYIDATLWNDLQVTNATDDGRKSELGIIDAVKESTGAVNYIGPSAEKAMREHSSLRGFKIPVIEDQTVVVNQTPGFNNIPANLPESNEYTFTAYDFFTGFRHYPASYANNTVDADYARGVVMNNVAYALGNAVEGTLSTVMEARKSQILNYTDQVSGTADDYDFNASTDTLEIKKVAQEETMFYSLSDLMGANELPGDYRIVTNRAGLTRQKMAAIKYGAGNEKNLEALGFLGLDRIHESGNISAGSDKFNGFLLRDGSIGMYENFPWDFRNNTMVDGKKWSISDVELPHVKMRANIYTNSAATDATSLITAGSDSNLIMSHFEEMAIWLRFYVVYRYNGDLATRANDIVKIKGLST